MTNTHHALALGLGLLLCLLVPSPGCGGSSSVKRNPAADAATDTSGIGGGQGTGGFPGSGGATGTGGTTSTGGATGGSGGAESAAGSKAGGADGGSSSEPVIDAGDAPMDGADKAETLITPLDASVDQRPSIDSAGSADAGVCPSTRPNNFSPCNYGNAPASCSYPSIVNPGSIALCMCSSDKTWHCYS